MRIKDTALLSALKLYYDECEITGETSRLHLHHVILKSQGGDDLRENILCVAGWLHDDYHQARKEARYMIARHVATLRPDVALYVSEKLGSEDAYEWWLEQHGVR